MNNHVDLRCDERLTPIEKKAAIRVAEEFAKANPKGDHAVEVVRFSKELRGEYWGEESNGNTIVAIVRKGRPRTIMLRRSTQPFTTDSLRVDKCWKVRIA